MWGEHVTPFWPMKYWDKLAGRTVFPLWKGRGTSFGKTPLSSCCGHCWVLTWVWEWWLLSFGHEEQYCKFTEGEDCKDQKDQVLEEINGLPSWYWGNLHWVSPPVNNGCPHSLSQFSWVFCHLKPKAFLISKLSFQYLIFFTFSFINFGNLFFSLFRLSVLG